MQALLDLYECLGDATRLRLLRLLQAEGEVCVCHLHEALDLPQAQVSKHLAYLRARDLVRTRREGRWIHYRLPSVAERSDVFQANLGCLRNAARKDPVLRADAHRFAELVACSCDPSEGAQNRRQTARLAASDTLEHANTTP